jgi:ketosteroid isomerase-like protein
MRRLALRVVVVLPGPLRRRVLFAAFRHAERAFNEGDLEAVFAAFAEDVEYLPPAALPGARPMRGKADVLAFWEGIEGRFASTIETSELREPRRGTIFRAATLRHREREGNGATALEYGFEQLTEISGGEVVRQRNVLVD